MESGGFELGFERAGIETVLQAERDPWCLEVLARHWPGTERVNDVRSVGVYDEGDRWGDGKWQSGDRLVEDIASAPVGDGRKRQYAPASIDLVYGGFPCQDLSVAGKRAGLGGERSGLWFEFERVLRELRPRWAVIENVPGLLSSNQGRDFGVLLDGLDELGFDVAWAILDAQHFGVPQRRRRLFIVAGPRGRGPEQVLSLCESCGGDPETGQAAGEDIAYTLAAGARGTGDGHGNAWNSTYIANPLGAHESGGYRDDLDHSTYVWDASGLAPILDRLTPAIAIRTANTGANGHGIAEDVAHTLDGAQGQAVVAATLQAKKPNETRIAENILPLAGGVRRLTPRECERLQGWPDDHTRWTADGREIADSHRYRMIGNGVASPCAEWIGHRLMAVDGMAHDQARTS